MWWYDPTYYIFILPCIIISMICQAKVNSAFKTYSAVRSQNGMTGYDAARKILDDNGLQHVQIERVAGNLTDHFDPKKNVIRLSDSVYASPTVAAVGVAAHEAGHAVQYGKHYAPIKIRNAFVPVANIGSNLAVPLVILGFLFEALRFLVPLGILLYGTVFLFQLLTLPVEFNASARAIGILGGSGMLTQSEVGGVKKVLSAAAMTYVAAMLTALMSLLRLVFLANRRDD